MRSLFIFIIALFTCAAFGAETCYVNRECRLDEDGTPFCDNAQISCGRLHSFACDYAHESCDQNGCVVSCQVAPHELAAVTIEAGRLPEPYDFPRGGITGYGADGGDFETQRFYGWGR